ncbi:hypothetical protein OKW41_009101 [Paraburkholderia sp. UCT70]
MASRRSDVMRCGVRLVLWLLSEAVSSHLHGARHFPVEMNRCTPAGPLHAQRQPRVALAHLTGYAA